MSSGATKERVRRAIDGAPALAERFERISREVGPALARTARSYAKTAGEREDLEQDIAFALWRALPGFRGECSERVFALRVAHNQALTFMTRRRARRPAEELGDELRAEEPDPEVLAGVSERMRRMLSVLHAMPFAARQILLLALEGLSHEEIGHVLGTTAGNVAVRINRARSDLRREMGEGDDRA